MTPIWRTLRRGPLPFHFSALTIGGGVVVILDLAADFCSSASCFSVLGLISVTAGFASDLSFRCCCWITFISFGFIRRLGFWRCELAGPVRRHSSRLRPSPNSAANGETETTRNATVNENAESETSNMTWTVNDKAEMDVIETKNETTNENAGKPTTHSPWPTRDDHDLLGSSPATNKIAETPITENKNANNNKNAGKEATKNSRTAR